MIAVRTINCIRLGIEGAVAFAAKAVNIPRPKSNFQFRKLRLWSRHPSRDEMSASIRTLKIIEFLKFELIGALKCETKSNRMQPYAV